MESKVICFGGYVNYPDRSSKKYILKIILPFKNISSEIPPDSGSEVSDTATEFSKITVNNFFRTLILITRPIESLNIPLLNVIK